MTENPTLSPLFIEVKRVNKIYVSRALELGKYIAETKSTVRQTAKHFGISKSTVHTDVSKRLEKIDGEVYERVRAVLDENKAQRHLRGGIATREKYIKLQK